MPSLILQQEKLLEINYFELELQSAQITEPLAEQNQKLISFVK
jgi:hypothetical protein